MLQLRMLNRHLLYLNLDTDQWFSDNTSTISLAEIYVCCLHIPVVSTQLGQDGFGATTNRKIGNLQVA